jgi:hypothetical protein
MGAFAGASHRSGEPIAAWFGKDVPFTGQAGGFIGDAPQDHGPGRGGLGLQCLPLTLRTRDVQSNH